MKVIFMGTSNFAIPVLQKLIDSNHTIVGVYTKAVKLNQITTSVDEDDSKIQKIALSHDIPVFRPRSLKTEENIQQFQSLQADIAVVASYGLILNSTILNTPKYGCINLHPSSLPRWRGSAPLQRSIMFGDEDSSICIIQMDTGVDTGDIILRENFNLRGMNFTQATNYTAHVGGKLILQALQLIENGNAFYSKQPNEGITYAHKIEKHEEMIDWNRTAKEIYCQIMGLSETPGAYFVYNKKRIKVYDAEIITQESLNTEQELGTILNDEFHILCGNNTILRPLILQKEGKKRMDIKDFLLGWKQKR